MHSCGTRVYGLSIFDCAIKSLMSKSIDVIVYEKMLSENEFLDSGVVNNLEIFKREADLVITNRSSDHLVEVAHKVYTLDIFGGGV